MFIIVFTTVGNLHHLGRAETWYGDGTFSVCPYLFYQLYTIHAEVHGQILPLVFNLLPSKSKRCYQFMWLQLRNLMQEKGINLELAPIETVLPVFIPENISTCFFHFAQAHWRKIQRLGLVDLYVSNEQYSVLLRSFTSLAFVPTERVPEYFKYLSDSVPEDAPTAIHDFVEYIVDTYVGHEIYDTAENEGAGLVLRIREHQGGRN